MNPLSTTAPRTRAEFETVVRELYEPLRSHFSPGNARVRPVATGSHCASAAAELEGFSRPLWGLVPLGVHGDFDDWARFREGLVNGTDPDHDEYWGPADDHDQRHVEMAAIGLGLALVPEELWEPLSETERANLADWLNQINDADLPDCNWLFFRVLTNLGLRSVGAEHDPDRTAASLDELESYAVGDGWYTDGPPEEGAPVDYYVPWAIHYYGLLYAVLAEDDDPERAARFRERARSFATHHRAWFDADGRALPYGRSLTYRFAQAGFWGALAFAGVEALPWGQIRGLWARNVRWWLDQPIFTDGGVLSVGYRYPTLKTSEEYNSPNSPYWALKAFLPLALPADHPFWRADEAPLPDLPETTAQPEPGLVVCRDDGHVFALSAGQRSVHGRAKYAKFAYSSAFGFSVGSRRHGPGLAGHDSTLALSLDGESYRIRGDLDETACEDGVLRSRWTPWDGVRVDSWVAPALPWHVRLHRVRTERRLHVDEGGFAIARPDGPRHGTETTDSGAVVRSDAGTSAVRDPLEAREACVVHEEPNTNLYHPRTSVPTLRATLDPDTHWLATAARAHPDRAVDADAPRPTVRHTAERVVVEHDGERVLRVER
ncbi:hypothetical protein GCM10009037_01320 [Halarchaeum grantii]|uniref:DUF2264 domain-containing protein n=1 Tax=Halarchaeum grantii TaxID=1193105 RepID=A0A830F5J8_9EURY|nr:DUF2264 domain-containing protein [Halarchaeum grantii]GGL21729.1 hypothetical protein GCM10009037_01320 [Halarchaeum grantii]